MQQIADWLEKLGLGQYAQRFAENGISAAALPHLTNQDDARWATSIAISRSSRRVRRQNDVRLPATVPISSLRRAP